MRDVFFLYEKQPGTCDRKLVASANLPINLRIEPATIEDIAIEWRLPDKQLLVWVLKGEFCYIAKTRSRNPQGYEDQRVDPRGTGETVHGALEALRDRLLSIPHYGETLNFIGQLMAAIPEEELDLASFRSLSH